MLIAELYRQFDIDIQCFNAKVFVNPEKDV